MSTPAEVVALSGAGPSELRSTPSVADALRKVAALTPAQRAVLQRLGAAGEPQTAGVLAEGMGVRASSVREILDVLLAEGLVRRMRMPVIGPGRPSFGYEAVAPTGVDQPMGMFLDILASTAVVLRGTHPTPAAAAQDIGRAWADRLVGQAVPRHDTIDDEAYRALPVADHLDKVAFFFSSLGFAATVSEDRRLVACGACPFMRDGQVDTLVCEMHRGMTERIIDVTSGGRAAADLRPWATRASCDIEVTEVSTPPR